MNGGAKSMFSIFNKASFRLVCSIFIMFGLVIGPNASVFAAIPDWMNVGSPNVSGEYADGISLAIHDGTPYVAYRDGANDYKATVKKFDGSNWVPVGSPGFSYQDASNPSLAIGNDGTPYVAYTDTGNGSKATVMKFDGSNWVPVGSVAFSDASAWNISLAINGNTPYVAYADNSFGGGQRAIVMEYDGDDWVPVGDTRFSTGVASDFSLVIHDGTPYVAYRDGDEDDKATVMQFDGDDWVNVGIPGFSAGVVSSVSLAISGDGTPYVAYADNGNSWYATVMQFDGDDWVNVGTPGFSGEYAMHTSLAINDDGTPYVAYGGPEATVMKFDGSDWVPVGSTGFSIGSAAELSLAINDDGTPYVAYRDSEGVVGGGWRATVMKYDYDLARVNLNNAENNKKISLSTPAGTEITCSSVSKAGDDGGRDSQYSYPLGLVNFCFDTDSTDNEVSLTFITDLKPSDVVARKYDPDTKAYATIPGAVITETTLDGQHALKLTYTVVDNGPLDKDPTVGKITDPVGLGLAGGSNAGAPNTGLESRSDLIWPVIVGGVVLLGFAIRRVNTKTR